MTDLTLQDEMLPWAMLAVRAVRLARVVSGERVAVCGEGAVARLVQAHLRDVGAEEVDPSMASVAVETTGDPETVVSLLETMKPHARIVLLGPSHGRAGDVDLYRTVHKGSLEVIGVSVPTSESTEDSAAVQRLLDSGPVC